MYLPVMLACWPCDKPKSDDSSPLGLRVYLTSIRHTGTDFSVRLKDLSVRRGDDIPFVDIALTVVFLMPPKHVRMLRIDDEFLGKQI